MTELRIQQAQLTTYIWKLEQDQIELAETIAMLKQMEQDLADRVKEGLTNN